MTNSDVAFVRRTIFVRSVVESGFGVLALAVSFAIAAAGVAPGTVPRVLRARESWMTVWRAVIEQTQ